MAKAPVRGPVDGGVSRRYRGRLRSRSNSSPGLTRKAYRLRRLLVRGVLLSRSPGSQRRTVQSRSITLKSIPVVSPLSIREIWD